MSSKLTIVGEGKPTRQVSIKDMHLNPKFHQKGYEDKYSDKLEKILDKEAKEELDE